MTEPRTREQLTAEMERVDNMSPDLRMVVHVWGIEAVEAAVSIGITDPVLITDILEEQPVGG